MSLSKLIGLLSAKSLIFSQLRKVAERDVFEAGWSKSQVEVGTRVDQDDQFALDVYSRLLAEGKVEDSAKSDEDRIRVSRQVLGTKIQNTMRNFNLRASYVSCWYTGEHEPAGMWSAYASENDGVVLRTTQERLKNSFANCEEKIYSGMVEYNDYAAQNFAVSMQNTFSQVYSKRIEYASEKELRLCFIDSDQIPETEEILPQAEVHEIDCDLNCLIHEIRVAPFAGDWLIKAVQSLVSQYGISTLVRRSALIEI